MSARADVLILGAGLAAVSTALYLVEQQKSWRIVMVTRGRFGRDSSSGWAQGGIAVALGPEDSPANHAKDTLSVGGGLCDAAMVTRVTEAGPDAIAWLEKQGVVFDRQGVDYSLGREAAHSCPRILHVGGDNSGAQIMTALEQRLRACPTIELHEDTEALTLTTNRTGRVSGAVLCTGETERPWRQEARATVLATGGLGQLFSRSTNPSAIRGNSLALAAGVGAELIDLEFVQFHPTAIDSGKDFKPGRPQPLATEALRGRGAILTNNTGARFMAAHPEQELAPRDTVARAIFREWQAGRTPKLDCTTAIGARFSHDFPTVFTLCQTLGLDPVTTPIPVIPAVHYHMGGVRVDWRGRSSRAGLWACGEAACTGLHGANRLASNSLLEALVCGRYLATDLAEQASDLHRVAQSPPPDSSPLAKNLTGTLTTTQQDLIANIQQASFQALGVIRHARGLNSYLTFLDQLAGDPCAQHHHIAQLVMAGRLIALCARARCESRGAHFREDASATDDRYRRRLTITSNQMSISKNLRASVGWQENPSREPQNTEVFEDRKKGFDAPDDEDQGF